MTAVLTMNTGSITCLHSGKLSTSSTELLQVNGKAVLLGEKIEEWNIKGCKTINNQDKGNQPCLRVTSVKAGFAQKLRVNNQPVILEAPLDWGETSGTVGGVIQPLAASVAGQTKLRAI